MTEKNMTRREVLRFLGIEIPVLLVSTQILTSEAGAEVIKKTFTLDRQQLLDMMNNPNSANFAFSSVYDKTKKVYGTKIETLPGVVASVMDPKGVDLESATVWSINGGTSQEWSQAKVVEILGRCKQLVETAQPLVIDLDINDQSYQYVIKYN